MKKILTVASLSCAVALGLSISGSVLAGPMPIKPGLWEVAMKIKTGGQEIDPQAQLKAAMSKMSPEQKKQMAAMLAKSGVNVGLTSTGGTRICYTKELLDSGKGFGQDPNRNCDSTIKSQTATHMVMEFKCEDGSTGSGDWSFQSDASYSGKMKLTDKNGKPSEFTHSGKFIGSDCGDVKPFKIPTRG